MLQGENARGLGIVVSSTLIVCVFEESLEFGHCVAPLLPVAGFHDVRVSSPTIEGAKICSDVGKNLGSGGGDGVGGNGISSLEEHPDGLVRLSPRDIQFCERFSDHGVPQKATNSSDTLRTV